MSSPDRFPYLTGARPLPAFSRMLRLTRPSREDAIAFVILGGLSVVFFHAAQGTVAPQSTPKMGRLRAPRGRFTRKANSSICRESVGLAILLGRFRIPVAVSTKRLQMSRKR